MGNFWRNHRGWTIGIIAAIIIAIGGLVTAWLRNGVYNAGAGWQTTIIQDKNNVGIELSTCVNKSNVSTQAAILQSQSVQQILTSALAARYQGNGNPQTQALPNNGSLISALQEQYPTVDVSTWKQLLVVVNACNDDIKDAQVQLQGDAAQFDAWTQQGNPFSKGIHGSFPNAKLTTLDAHGNTLTGEAALKALKNPVLLDQARIANNSGSMPQQNLPGFGTPAPSTTAASPSSTR